MKHSRLHPFVYVVGCVLLGFSACSELRDDLPPVSIASLKVHPDGWTKTASTDFHGITIRQNNWDMRQCQTCHGRDYRGGVSGVSCQSCHTAPGGPEACNTCHGGANNAPPRDLSGNTAVTARGVGAHQTHVRGTSRADAVPCSECHNVPGALDTPGHIDTPSPAEVVFTGFLSSKATQGFTPSYNAQTGTCANSYCHGNFKNGNPTNAMVWNAFTPSSTACGTCHGNPSKPTLAEQALPKTSADGGTHPNVLTCANCHGDVVNASLQIISVTKHMNGKLNVFGTERDL
jgi:predicted CxxxxCH...CXXCH cytochrome family protein